MTTKFTDDQIERSPHVRKAICTAPYSIPESDGVVIFDTSDEMSAYLNCQKK